MGNQRALLRPPDPIGTPLELDKAAPRRTANCIYSSRALVGEAGARPFVCAVTSSMTKTPLNPNWPKDVPGTRRDASDNGHLCAPQ